MGAVHELQVRAHGAQGASRQHCELGLELLFELFEFGWWHEAEFAKRTYKGGRGVAALVERTIVTASDVRGLGLQIGLGLALEGCI